MRKVYRYLVSVWVEAPTEEEAKNKLIELMETDYTVMEYWDFKEGFEDGSC